MLACLIIARVLLTLNKLNCVRTSLIPLIVLLIILLAGCIYYLRISGLTLRQALKLLFTSRPVRLELRDKSLKELYDLLSANKSLEQFEKCAEIRDELRRRTEEVEA